MNALNRKWREIYLPSLLISWIFIVVYSFIHWFFIIIPGIDIKEELVDFWASIALVWIPVLIWIRPRLQLLNLTNSRVNGMFGCLLLASVMIAIPNIMAQKYLRAVTGKLTELRSIGEISSHKASKYYSVDSFFADKNKGGVFRLHRVSGKRSQHLEVYLYFATPMYEWDGRLKKEEKIALITPGKKSDREGPLLLLNGRPVDSITLAGIPTEAIASIEVLENEKAQALFGGLAKNGVVKITTSASFEHEWRRLAGSRFSLPPAWLCVKYEQRFDNKDDEKDMKIDRFVDESMDNFKNRDLDKFTYADRLGNNKDRKGFRMAVDRARTLYKDAEPTILVPHFRPFEERTGTLLPWVFGSFAIGAGIWCLILLFPKYRN